MAVRIISEEEYLRTSYEPHCEYVDGVLEPKALAGPCHSLMHGFLITKLLSFRESHRIQVLPSLHIRIRAGRYRVPDLTIMPEGVGKCAPLGIFEVLEKTDTMRAVHQHVADYRDVGAFWTVIVDPRNRCVFEAGPDGLLNELAPPHVARLPLRDRPELVIDFDALFAKLPTEPDEEP